MTKKRNKWLHKIYFKIPPKKRYAFLDSLPPWFLKLLKFTYRSLTVGEKVKQKISSEQKRNILYWYENEIRKTEKLLGKGLNVWRKV